MIREITLKNILSFGPDSQPIRLEKLNVLIGSNGSGKSNFIDALQVLRIATYKQGERITLPGGVRDWIWQGNKDETASINVVLDNPINSEMPLRHVISFREANQKFELLDEKIENAEPYGNHRNPIFYYHFNAGSPYVNIPDDESRRRALKPESVIPNLSILAQRDDPEAYPEITHLILVYNGMKFYVDWQFGRANESIRRAQKADMRNDFMMEDYSNFGLILNQFKREPQSNKHFLSYFKEFYDGIDGFEVITEGNTVQVFLHERGEYSIPSTRLSDGTLRYMSLLAILCHPKPPSLVCIEEPEIGLHPDIIPKLAELLVEASERTQIIITTHSDVLIDALSMCPESVVVCEKHDGQTQLERLDGDELGNWLGNYSLGKLWNMGKIGGSRW